MSIRRRALPEGWYPRDGVTLRRLVEGWKLPHGGGGARAAIAPHAGFAFSGRIAAIAWSSLAEAETVVIVGGHLSAASAILVAPEESFESPDGPLKADLELKGRLLESLGAAGLRVSLDRDVDNTVEVQLPFAGLYAKGARILWLRAPASPSSLGLGRSIREAAASLGRRVAVVGSTDLTHYGPDYGFEPAGSGEAAEPWVREVNDRAFLDALLAMNGEEALRRAREDGSACSPGAAVAALSFAMADGSEKFAELAYATSLDVRRAPSFVGYAALASV
ncbi:MAG TPA: AmmeMemoRadiSam system protein B [Rectinemataceae bacterium]|nr:AmmeMemoRadiSam system protein B [Rectinemataceae bacterium]